MMDWAIPVYQSVLAGVALAVAVAALSRDVQAIRCAVVLALSEVILWALWYFGVFAGNVYVGLVIYVAALVGVFWPPAGALQTIVSGIYLSMCGNRLLFILTDQANGAYALMWQFEQVAILLIIAAICVHGVPDVKAFKHIARLISIRVVVNSPKDRKE